MLSLIRLDDRLIHGQVMAVWARQLEINHIVVVDDRAAADAFESALMQAAMPAGIALDVCAGAAAPAILTRLQGAPAHTLVLLRSIDAALALHQGFPLRHLNVGNLGLRAGRALVWRSIALSQGELTQLHALQAQGVPVFMQMNPSDKQRPLPARLPLAQ